MLEADVGKFATPGVAPHEPVARRLVVAIFAIVCSVYLATATYTVGQANDTRAAAVSAWSLGQRGTLDLPALPDIPWQSVGRDGELHTDRFPGVIAWGAPFYALAPREVPPDVLRLNFVPAALAGVVASALAATVVFRLLADRHRRSLAIGATALFAFGTATWSVSADALWPHGPAQLAMAAALLAMQRGRWNMAGLAFLVAAVIRPHLAIAGWATAGMVMAYTGAWRRGLPLAIGAALGVALVSLYTWVMFGSWLPAAGYEVGALTGEVAGFGNLPRQAYGALLDRSRGVLVFSPFLLPLLPGVRAGWGHLEAWQKAAALGGAAYLFVQLTLNRFSGGSGFFAYRLPLESMTLAVPVAVAAWDHWTRKRQVPRLALLALGAVSIGIHAYGAVWLSIPRSDQVAWAEMLDRAERGRPVGFEPPDACDLPSVAEMPEHLVGQVDPEAYRAAHQAPADC